MAGRRSRVADRGITVFAGGSTPPVSDAGTATFTITSPVLAFPSTPLLDDFNAGANQNVDTRAGWKSSGSYPDFWGSMVTDAVPTFAAGYISSNAWGTQFADPEVWSILGAWPAVNDLRLYARWDDTVQTGYWLQVFNINATNWFFQIRMRLPGGGDITLPGGITVGAGGFGGATLVAGDGVGFSCVGSQLMAWLWKGGVWTPVISVQDSTYNRKGDIGLGTEDHILTFDSFGGGESVSGAFQAIADAGTNTGIVLPDDTETISDAGTATAVFSFTASESLLGGALSDAGTVTFSVTPTAAETIRDITSTSFVLAQTDSEVISDAGTCTMTLAPSAAAQTISEPATVTLVLAPSAQETVSEAATNVIAIDPTYPSVVLADGPDVYYRLNETGAGAWVDSANGHNATPNGTIIPHASLLPADPDPDTTLDPTSTAWRAVTGYLLDNQPLTVEFWINPTSLAPVTPGYSAVVSCSNASNGWMVSYLQGSLGGWWRFSLPGVADYVFQTTAAPAAVGVLQHIAMVFKVGNTVDLYINGVLAETLSTGSKIAATGGTLRIGQIGTATTAQVSAALGELAIYKAALSGAQIAKHYAIGAQPSPQTIVDSGTCYVGVECGDSTPVLDDFNKGAGQNVSARAGWGSASYWGAGEPTLVVNGVPDAMVVPNTTGWFANYWNQSFGDQESGGTIGVVGVAQSWAFATRSTVGNTPSEYELTVNEDTGAWTVELWVAGALSATLATGTFPSHAAGDSMKLRSVGSTHTVWFKPSGGSWARQASVSDATLASGFISVQGRAVTTPGSLTDFFGGGLATPAVESVTGGSLSDSGTATLALLPSASEQVQDASTVIFVLTEADSDRESDQGTVSISLTPSATASVVDTGASGLAAFAIARGDLFGPDDLVNPDDVAGPDYVHGFEAIVDTSTATIVLAPSDTERISDAGTATLAVAPTAVQTINDAGSIAYTLAETSSETIVDSGSQSVVLTPTGAQTPADSGTCALSVTPTSAETLVEAASLTLVLSPSYAFTWPDAGTVTIVLVQTAVQTISEGGSTFVIITPVQQGADQGTVTIVLANTATETIRDAGTATVGITPSAAETLRENANEFFAVGRGDLFAPDDLVYPDDIAGPDYVHGFEAIIDASSVAVVFVPANQTQTIIDSGSTLVVITPVQQGVEQGVQTIVLSNSATELLRDAGTATISVTPTAAETLRENANEFVAIARGDLFAPDDLIYPDDVVGPDYVHGFEAIIDTNTVAFTLAPSATETRVEAATVTIVLAEAAGATDNDAGTATVVFVSSGAEAIVQSATVTFVLSESETDLITAFDSGTATLVVVSSAAETLLDAGTQTATLTPSAAGQAAELATVSFSLAPSGAETLKDAGTQPVVLSQTATELVFIGEAGTATFTITPTSAETIRDGATQSFAIVLNAGESFVQASTQIVVLSPIATQNPTDSGTVSLTLVSDSAVAQSLEAGTVTLSADGTGAETLVAAAATVTFVVTPTYFGGAPGAAGNLSITLSQTATQTLNEGADSATNLLVLAPSHTWTAGFDVNPPKPPLEGGDAAVRRRQHDRAARIKALRTGDPQHRDRKLVRR